jgi:DNA-binding CsgD family transcriptional regulator
MRPAARQPPLQEREHHVRALVNAAAATDRDTGGRIIVVEGPAGIGKTRLLAEVRDRLRRQHHRTALADGRQLESDFAYGVVRRLLKPMFAGEQVDSARDPLFAGAAAKAASVFGAEAAAPVGDLAVLHGLYWLVVNVCAEAPLTVIVDDVQHADQPTLRLLAYLRPRLDGLPLTLILALTSGASVSDTLADSDMLAEILQAPATTLLRPEPLGRSGAATVLGAMFGTRPDDAFVAACYQSTGGNPLLLTELARSCLAHDIDPVAANAGRVGSVRSSSLASRVADHLETLPPGVVAVAHAVALLGDEADLPAVAAVAGVTVEAAAIVADWLLRSELLVRAPGSGRLAYPHQLLRATAYEHLDPDRRDQGHRAAALHLAAVGSEPELVAAHLLRVPSRLVPDAAQWLRRAAETALGRGSPDVAYTYLRRALAEATEERTRAELLDQLAGVAMHTDVAAAARHGEEALALAASPAARTTIGLRLGEARLFQGDTAGAVRAWRAARTALTAAGDATESAGLGSALDAYLVNVTVLEPDHLHLMDEVAPSLAGEPPLTVGGQALACVLALRAAFEARPEAAGMAGGALADGRLVRHGTGDSPLVCGWLALLAAESDQAAASIAHARREVYRQGSVRAYGAVHAFAALDELWRGNLADAEREARAAVEAVERSGVRLGRPFVAAFLADILAERGDLAGAQAALAWAGLPTEPPPVGPMYFFADTRARLLRQTVGGERALAAALDAGRRVRAFGGDNPAFVPWRSEAARTLHRMGRTPEAKRLALAEVELARRWGAPRPWGRALRVAGVVLGAHDGFHLLCEAVDVLAGSLARLEYAKALLDLAGAAHRRGERDWARELLGTAAELGARCDCPPLLRRVDAALTAIDGRSAASPAGRAVLTTSERRVADLAATGMSNREIAESLFVTPKTVELHLTNTYRKLRINGRVGLLNSLAAHSVRSA